MSTAIARAALLGLILCTTCFATSLPMWFEPAGRSSYVLRGGTYAVHLSGGEVAIALPGSGKSVRLRWLNALPTVPAGRELLPGQSNYLIGSERSKWRTHVPQFGRLFYEQLYCGIDAVFYIADGRLQFDFTVAPGADPGQIRFAVDGSERVTIAQSGELEIRSGSEAIRLKTPFAFQETAGGRKPVRARFRLRDRGVVSLAVGRYDRSQQLTIDPVLIYSTYLPSVWLRGIAADPDGNAYFTGSIQSPTAQAFSGAPWFVPEVRAFDAFVAKVSADGSKVLYWTHLGGAFSEEGRGLVIDRAGRATVVGSTNSPDFPIANPPAGASATATPFTSFISRLTADGSSFEFSTYVDAQLDDVTADSAGMIYATGWARTNPFPFASRGESLAGGDMDVVVLKIDPRQPSVVYSTLFGGSRSDAGIQVSVDGHGNAHLLGRTSSPDFPRVHPLPSEFLGYDQRFLVKLDVTGSRLIYSTYAARMLSSPSGATNVWSIAADQAGNTFITGTSQEAFAGCSNFPEGGGLFVGKLRLEDGLVGGACPIPNATSGRTVIVDSAGRPYVGGSLPAEQIGPGRWRSPGFIARVTLDLSRTELLHRLEWVPVCGTVDTARKCMALAGADLLLAGNEEGLQLTLVNPLLMAPTDTYLSRLSLSDSMRAYEARPHAAIAGSGDFTLDIVGVNFPAGATLLWNGQPRSTTFVSATRLSARIPATDVANVREVQLTVRAPGPSAVLSNALPFRILPSTGCTMLAYDPDTNGFPPEGGNGRLWIRTPAGCLWIVSSIYLDPPGSSGWISASPSSGVGSADIAYTVAPNPGPTRRAEIRVGDVIARGVQQAGRPVITRVFPPRVAAGEAVTLTVYGRNFVPGFGEFGPPRSYIYWNGRFKSGARSSGQFSLPLTEQDVAAPGEGIVYVVNLDLGGRSNEVRVPILPAGSCPYALSDTTMTVPASAGSAGTQVAAPPNCAWLARSNAPWIVLTSGPSGSGNGAVYFSFEENTAATARTGTVTVQGETLALSQQAAQSPSLEPGFEPSYDIRGVSGFAVLEVRLAADQPGGYWGIGVLTSRASTALHSGGSVNFSGRSPAFAAFLVLEAQNVKAVLAAQTAAGTQLRLRFLDSNGQQVGADVAGSAPLQLEQRLEPGFYVATVSNAAPTPFTYQLSIEGTRLEAGFNAGGYIGPGITGFVALPLQAPSSIRVYGSSQYGVEGAGSLILTVRLPGQNPITIGPR